MTEPEEQDSCTGQARIDRLLALWGQRVYGHRPAQQESLNQMIDETYIDEIIGEDDQRNRNSASG